MKQHGMLRRTILPVVLGGTIVLTVTGCMGPTMSLPTQDVGWNTEYYDALSPHTQLALGVMHALKETPELIPPASRSELVLRWQKLADLIKVKAAPEEINNARREVEARLDGGLVNEIKEEKRTTGDLMGFMMSSGVRMPKGGMANLNPDHIAATKVIEALNKTVTK